MAATLNFCIYYTTLGGVCQGVFEFFLNFLRGVCFPLPLEQLKYTTVGRKSQDGKLHKHKDYFCLVFVQFAEAPGPMGGG